LPHARPAHWAAFPNVTGTLPASFDELAARAGLADGAVLLEKTAGQPRDRIAAARPHEIREWFYAAYDRHSGESPASLGDMVAHGCGMWLPGSGWDGMLAGNHKAGPP
jgi:hypothetical protein